MHTAETVKIRLKDYGQKDVDTLRAALEQVSGVKVTQAIDIQASSVQDVLGAVLSHVTLIAQIGAQVALIAGNAVKVVAVVKQWIAHNPPKPGQTVEIDPS